MNVYETRRDNQPARVDNLFTAPGRKRAHSYNAVAFDAHVCSERAASGPVNN
jgi:hypothetical protein